MKIAASIIIMGAVTYAIRLLPLTFFRRRIKNPYIKSFLNFVPFAVLGAMTFPDVFTSAGSVGASLAGLAAALVLSYMEKGLLTVSAAACAAAFAADLIIRVI